MGVKIGSKRPKLNPDVPPGRHSSPRHHTVGGNVMMQLLEPFEGKPCSTRRLSRTADVTPVARISVHTGTIRLYFGKGQHSDVGEPTAGHSDYYKCLYTRISIEIGGRYSGRNHTRKTPEGSGGKENVHTKSFHCSENLILRETKVLF